MNGPVDEPDHARTRRRVVGAGLLAVAAAGVPLLVPLAFPNLDAPVARTLLLGVGVILVVGLVLFWANWRARGKAAEPPVSRRWRAVGFGQGWIEIRVRTNTGGAFVVSANPGDGADKISFDISLTGKRGARRTETVEVVLEVDDQLFELDLPDHGGRSFSIHAIQWREVEHLRQIVAAFRRGSSLRVSVPAVGLATRFTLEGAFDELQEVEELGFVTDQPDEGSAFPAS